MEAEQKAKRLARKNRPPSVGITSIYARQKLNLELDETISTEHAYRTRPEFLPKPEPFLCEEEQKAPVSKLQQHLQLARKLKGAPQTRAVIDKEKVKARKQKKNLVIKMENAVLKKEVKAVIKKKTSS